jgi:hypothetical protein
MELMFGRWQRRQRCILVEKSAHPRFGEIYLPLAGKVVGILEAISGQTWGIWLPSSFLGGRQI